ncbi:MAG TPA: ABC transporter substrate-binding protein [Longilinea sp.]|nr:ABC transporter substrate-binding protein [Longilinea sp.]
MKSKKFFAILMLLALVLPILAGCAGTETTPVAEEGAAEVATEAAVVAEEPVATIADQVNVAIGADPADLSPFVGMSMGRIAVLHTIYEYLVDVPSMGAPWAPWLASDVQQVDDVTYDVTIFDYIYDSAGNHITASDVAWSYNTGIASGNLRPLGNVESVTVTGDYTVQFVFKNALGMGDLDKILSECPIISQAAFEASADQFATTPVTTAAYVLTEFIPGSSLTFEARPDYWQTDESLRPAMTQANVQTIVFQIISEASQHAIALQTGTADISGSVSGDDITMFQEGGSSADGFTVFTFRDNLTQVLSFNGSEGSPFTSQELRQAVAYAIDTTAMCEAVAPGACFPAHTIGNANFGGYVAEWDDQPYYEFDLAQAQELFAAAGYEAGGLTVRLLAQNDARSGLIAQIIQSQLLELGITVEINQVEPSVYNQLKLDPTAFDMIIDAAAGGDFAFSPWRLIFDQTMNNGTTSNWFLDNDLQVLLDTASSIAGYTPENLTAFNDYQKEMVYSYGLLSFANLVVSVEGITSVFRDGRGQIIPGACEYSADF